MGREASCICVWAGSTGTVKASLETSELFLRGDFRKSVPFKSMSEILVRGDQLQFKVGGDDASLALGNLVAKKWEAAIKNPPSLAKKLGITRESILRVIGDVHDDGLQSAIEEAAGVSEKQSTGNRVCTLILACVDSPDDVNSALRTSAHDLSTGVPIWFIYRKGPGHALNESTLRSIALATGLVDTKTASVSSALTALRFNRRRSNP